MYKIILVSLAAVCVAYASTALGIAEPKPAKFKNQEGCYFKELDQVIPIGKSAPSKLSCRRYVCFGDTYEVQDCGVVVGPCKQEADVSKPYPDCCPKIKC